MTALSSDFEARRFESVRRVAAVGFVLSLAILPLQASRAVETAPTKIAVFEFELKDTSAGGGVIAADAVDTENLKKSTDEARRLLSESGRYSVVDTSSVAGEVTSAGGIQACDGCDGPLAKQLGAEQSMVGVFTRVSRTEFTLQIEVREAETGEVVYSDFSGLMLGANYAWPRIAKRLVSNSFLTGEGAQ
jgi:hypothetical protein